VSNLYGGSDKRYFKKSELLKCVESMPGNLRHGERVSADCTAHDSGCSQSAGTYFKLILPVTPLSEFSIVTPLTVIIKVKWCQS
jgi:hypothetical protein